MNELLGPMGDNTAKKRTCGRCANSDTCVEVTGKLGRTMVWAKEGLVLHDPQPINSCPIFQYSNKTSYYHGREV